jgi:hypothetical protein
MYIKYRWDFRSGAHGHVFLGAGTSPTSQPRARGQDENMRIRLYGLPAGWTLTSDRR